MPTRSLGARAVRLPALALAVVLALAAALTGGSRAEALPSVDYRYWGFYQLVDGQWAFAEAGADQTVPEDGSVDGWRFAVSGEQSARYPRDILTFDEICGSTPAVAGEKRVGLVVDFGRTADSADGATPPEPKAYCASVPADASSADVLRAAGDLRSESGMICGIAGYPAADCGGEVADPAPEVSAEDTPVEIAAPAVAGAEDEGTTDVAASDDGPDVVLYVIAALVVLAVVLLLVLRSRARARQDA